MGEASTSPGAPDELVEGPARGASIDRFTVMGVGWRAAHAILLQARDPSGAYVAIKLARTEAGVRHVEREAAVLRSLERDPGPWPRYVAAGEIDGRRYLATGWLQGVEARVAALDDREERRRGELLGLCRHIASAYAELHAHGILHGLVHPRHVLVDGDGSVRLLDFSNARPAGSDRPPGAAAGRFDSLSSPEQARALLSGAAVATSAASEQYSVAALLHLLLTGRMYLRLGRERLEVAGAILANKPLRLAEDGHDPWPEFDAVLDRALDKDPRGRYPSMQEFATAIGGLSWSSARDPGARVAPVRSPLADALLAFRRDAGADADEWLRPPTCSINFGAAGVAFALTRLGKLTADAAALDGAERWLAVAGRRSGDEDAFDDGDELTPQTVGLVSPFHNVSGLAAVRALLSEAVGDGARQQAALDEFCASTQVPCANLDLTLGRSAVLLFAALLYANAQPDWPATARLGDYGDELRAGIWRDLDPAAIAYNGIAHGWAGIAYAALMWAAARRDAPPPRARDVLDLLAASAEPYRRGMRWPLTPPDGGGGSEYWPGWCHGNAGYVFLWNLARSVYSDERYGELAERAASLIEAPAGITSLCCGSAGQVYAVLNQYRSTGDERWRARALRIAERAVRDGELAGDAPTPLSLYKGHVGVALLAVELEAPECAAMPLFEFEPRARRPAATGA